MSFKMRAFQFTRTASVTDLRTDAATQERERIRRKALSYMMRCRTFGRASFT